MSAPNHDAIAAHLAVAIENVEERRRTLAAKLLRINRHRALIYDYAGVPMPDAPLPYTDDELKELQVVRTDRVEALLAQILEAVAVPQRQPRRSTPRQAAAEPLPPATVAPPEVAAPVVPDAVPVPDEGPEPGPRAPEVEVPADVAAHGEPVPEPPATDVAPVDASGTPPVAAPSAEPGGTQAGVMKAIDILFGNMRGVRLTAEQIMEEVAVVTSLSLHYPSPRMQITALRDILAKGAEDGRWVKEGWSFGAAASDAARGN